MFDLINVSEKKFDLTKDENYKVMAKVIQENLPVVSEASSHFGKSQSQFMDNFMTVSHPTPLRNARQILAELNRIIPALREAQFKQKRNEVKLLRYRDEISKSENKFDVMEREIDIAEIESQMEQGQIYIAGAIRSATNYIEQYNHLLKEHGIDKMNEADFEKEEEKYHIMKAFDQAICAARARGGAVDEGNHIYFSQIGINGSVAQVCISNLFAEEEKIIKEHKVPSPDFVHNFLLEMAKNFAGCSEILIKTKKLMPSTQTALIGHKV